MASCSGCGMVLGFKKYKFKKLWRIGGSYCRPCMVKIGEDWDEHVKLKDHFRSLKYYYIWALLISHRQQWNDIKK